MKRIYCAAALGAWALMVGGCGMDYNTRAKGVAEAFREHCLAGGRDPVTKTYGIDDRTTVKVERLEKVCKIERVAHVDSAIVIREILRQVRPVAWRVKGGRPYHFLLDDHGTVLQIRERGEGTEPARSRDATMSLEIRYARELDNSVDPLVALRRRLEQPSLDDAFAAAKKSFHDELKRSWKPGPVHHMIAERRARARANRAKRASERRERNDGFNPVQQLEESMREDDERVRAIQDAARGRSGGATSSGSGDSARHRADTRTRERPNGASLGNTSRESSGSSRGGGGVGTQREGQRRVAAKLAPFYVEGEQGWSKVLGDGSREDVCKRAKLAAKREAANQCRNKHNTSVESTRFDRCQRVERVNPNCKSAWNKYEKCHAKHSEEDVERVYGMSKDDYCKTHANVRIHCWGDAYRGLERRARIRANVHCKPKR